MTNHDPSVRPEAPQPQAVRRAAARAERHRTPRARASRPVRMLLFVAIAIVVGVGAIGLVVIRLQGPGATDTAAVQVHASMGASSPPR